MKKSSLLSNLHSNLRNSRRASKSCLHSKNLRNLRNLREIKSYLKYPQRNKKRQRFLVADCICALATASVLLGAFTSCSHTRYVAMPSSHSRDSLSAVVHKKVNNTYVERFHIERLLPTDTINSSPYAGGRGVVILDSIYVEKFTDIEVHDTIRVTQTDSVPYPVEVPKYIRQRNLYDRITAAGFWIGICIMFIGILLFLFGRFFARTQSLFY